MCNQYKLCTDGLVIAHFIVVYISYCDLSRPHSVNYTYYSVVRYIISDTMEKIGSITIKQCQTAIYTMLFYSSPPLV